MIVEPIWRSLLTESERAELRPGVPSPLPMRPDVLIVGGGLVGLSIACFLAEQQAGRILVVEQGDLACGASGANGGGIFPGPMRADFPAEFRKIGMASRDIFDEWSEQDWADFHWRRNGALAIATDEFPCPLAEHSAHERELGRRAEYLSGRQLHELEPALAADVEEAVYYPDDGQLNPLRLALCLNRRLRQLGVVIATSLRVERLKAHSGRIVQADTSDGTIHPGTVVLTAGWAARQLAEPLGVPLPLQPAKGHILATGPLNWQMQTNVLGSQLFRQLPSGELITGGTIEFIGESYEPTENITDNISEVAVRLIPALKDEPFVRVWTGLRPHTPDEMPMIDRLRGLENAFLAAGHFTKGVLLAPITGRLMAEWITTGRPSIDIRFLSLDRFAQV